MEKRDATLYLRIFLFALLLIALNALVTFRNYFSGGMTGLSIVDTLKENVKKINAETPLGIPILILSWVLLIMIALLAYLKYRHRIRRYTTIDLNTIKSRVGKSGTDIDILYEIIKEHGILRVSTISNIFEISKDKALDWCKILDEHNLARLNYPAFSEPELTKIELKTEKEIEEEKKAEEAKKTEKAKGEKKEEKPKIEIGEKEKSEKIEKKKWVIIGIVIGVIIIAVLLSFFITQKKEVQPEIGESIQDILAKAETIGPVQYEISTTSSIGETTTTVAMKVWQKIPYMKFESTTPGTTTKIIYRPDAMYVYDASKDKYSKITIEEMATTITQKSLEELSEEIKESETLKELGTETIDGKLTTIIEYSISTETALGETTITQKSWIWNEKGIPLKTESTTKMGEIVTTIKMEYKNFVFEDIPDSVFEIPADKIIES